MEINHRAIQSILFRQLAGEKLYSGEKELLDNYDAANPGRIEWAITEENLHAWSRYDRQKEQALALFRHKYTDIFPIEQPAVVRCTPLFSMRSWRMIAAAVMVLVVSVIAMKWLVVPKAAGSLTKHSITISPGSQKATLTLANQTTIELNENHLITSLAEGNAVISNPSKGQLVYRPGNGSSGPLFNILSTPKGGYYQVTLPDGTQVWLNAATTLHYPVAFTGPERMVDLQGEAYFEVAHDPAKPFIVNYGKGKIEVLGTRFNIKSYDDSTWQATLLEGSVRLHIPTGNILLTPAQRAQSLHNQPIEVKTIDTAEAIAWKNGYFQYNDVEITTILSDIARWYDLEINMEALPRQKFVIGNTPRSDPPETILDLLKASLVLDYTIEGRILNIRRHEK